MVTNSKDVIRRLERVVWGTAPTAAPRRDLTFPPEPGNHSPACLPRVLIPGLFLANFFLPSRKRTLLCALIPLLIPFTKAQLFQDHVPTGSNPCIPAAAGLCPCPLTPYKEDPTVPLLAQPFFSPWALT